MVKRLPHTQPFCSPALGFQFWMKIIYLVPAIFDIHKYIFVFLAPKIDKIKANPNNISKMEFIHFFPSWFGNNNHISLWSLCQMILGRRRFRMSLLHLFLRKCQVYYYSVEPRTSLQILWQSLNRACTCHAISATLSTWKTRRIDDLFFTIFQTVTTSKSYMEIMDWQ